MSPDGRSVALVEGGTDVVTVLELVTGNLGIILGRESRMIPPGQRRVN